MLKMGKCASEVLVPSSAGYGRNHCKVHGVTPLRWSMTQYMMDGGKTEEDTEVPFHDLLGDGRFNLSSN